MAEERKIRVAVVGVGAFGRNHARVYSQLAQEGDCELVALVDSDPARAQEVAREFGGQAFDSPQALSGQVDAASVAVPTSHHAAVAEVLMAAGIDVMVEKPLAASLVEADRMLESARRHGRIAQAGHLERFNPAVRATARLVRQPMFFEVHRLSIFTPRSLDVDVILDLMIHDLDIVLSLAASPVAEVRAVGIPVVSPRVDIANVRVQFESGCVANFTASRVSTERVRKLRFFQPHQYISVDYTRQDVLVVTVGEDAPASNLPAPPGLGGGLPVGLSKPAIAQEEPLHAELKTFLHAVRTRSEPLVTLADGRHALALALEIQEAIRTHNQRFGVQGPA